MNFPINFSFLVVLKINAKMPIGLLGRVFANSPGDRGSIQKTQKMVLDISLLNTQHDKGKVEQSKERSSAFPNTSV